MAVTIDVKADILGKNDAVAEELRNLFKEKHVFVLDLMGSPGCGKTTLLEKTMQALKDDINMAVIEGDLFTSKDADRIDRYGVPVVQINTAGGCHLDAPMIKKAIENIDLDKLDLLVIENVGNLVCPAEFDIGEQKRAVVLSITEGDDKPMKYPLMFKLASIVLLNKTDILKFCNFNLDGATEDIKTLNPGVEVLPVSCSLGDGLKPWLDWLREMVRSVK
ncbi:MAG: hydrogenase nickel incorporation protein HypB [Veillonellaceae bacterium]|nr:hydrogenase nickel incorporation protein HypB [Veillonellaceae bacterium]MDD6923936.1 hydrogenase nickel incorporation protein HypB [Veillonellaceae bacterium]